ncbi:YbaK/EbsC family protein [Paenibacillus sp. M1]|uniref:YbaK/EbsC family protein n=1 Tax=Paenibacillus haidiansis TaxID=1574488 RepID=A0ABU7VVI2_9BACL
MSIEAVKNYFRQWNMEDRVREFAVSSATVEEAAMVLGCEEQRIAKTMSFKLNDAPILIVMAGDARVDNSKYKAHFGSKAAMLKGDEVTELIGHPPGGVCPFAINEGIKVYLDKSLKRFETVFPACGSRSSAIELTLAELEKHSGYSEWVDVGKEWE